MDAFFAAVEERARPHLRGKPIVVGANPLTGEGRGVVSTANYAARRYGIHSAMPISKAWRLAQTAEAKGEPPVVWLTPHISRYGEISSEIMAIVRRFVSVIEQTSVDEAYLDLTRTGSFEAAEQLARQLKQAIAKNEHLTASIGIGPNKLMAKIASDWQKPDGLTVIRPEAAEEFLKPLSVRTLPGVGPKTEELLRTRGVRTVGDVKLYSEAELVSLLGKFGVSLYALARGNDDSPLAAPEVAKSLGEQHTFSKDIRDPNLLTQSLKELAASVFGTFHRDGFKSFGRVVVTVRFADFSTKTRSHVLAQPASVREVLEFESLKLFLPFLDKRENPERQAVRLIGVRMEKLE